MAKRNKRKVEEPKEITRKETRLRAKEREKNRRILLGAGAAIALVLLVLIIGAMSEFVLKPNSAVATVDGTKITTQDFRKRVLFEQANLQNQLFQYQQFEAQFGGQDLFASQIAQIQGTLASPFALGLDVLDQMIEDDVLATKAVELGVTVSEEEVDAALREEVAAIQGAVTVPQATSTAEAEVAATATAALFTPTPLPTVDASAPATATVEAPPTPAPQPTRPLLTDATYAEGVTLLEQNLQELSGMDLATYREITRSRLLRTKLQEQISPGLVTATEEQVKSSHILLRTQDPIPAPEASPTPLAEGEPTPEPTPAPRDDAATLALAQELRQRILDGEDFATLAQEFSEDPGSAINGGDLGWFPRGMMVAPFEEAAFSLPVGEVSEPIQTDFGYHLILVTERDDARPKDEGQIQQEEQQAFSNWISEQMLSANIERTDDLAGALPTGM